MLSGEEAEGERTESVTSGDLLSDGQLQRLKRLRNDQGEKDNDDFIEVTRKTRRIASKNSGKNTVSNMCTTQPALEAVLCYDVCVTSIEPLPKQIAFAKLLRSLKIPEILKIKYKSSYKVIITVDKKEHADSILSCEQLAEKGLRCQRTDEMNVCYGIVRQIDLETKIEDIHKDFECECEIVSVRRLKRQTSEGSWTDSETVRLCFRASTLPPYVTAYGCRLMVEAYTFPVSQCAGCWKYGHIKKYCPTRKIVCPKCGANHVNCETNNFTFINCKGCHMSIEKSRCPAFKKKKDIRKLMCEEQCTYKKALSVLLDRQKSEAHGTQETITPNVRIQTEYNLHTCSRSYSEALLRKSQIQNRDEELLSDANSSNASVNLGTQSEHNPETQRKKKRRKRQSINKEQQRQDEHSECVNENVPNSEKKFNFSKFYNRVKEIILSRKLLSEKITDFLNVVFEECYLLVAGMLRKGDYVSKLLSMLGHG